ncbi:MAG TPA: phosphatase PAP2 family protein [Sphingomicrobium sp.]|nr:phosphatase PAP2 family protein [Sphingomicrobium sp.]
MAVPLTVSVGCSRIYLGVHWPSDVAAGFAVGAIWAAFCSLVAQHFQSIGTQAGGSEPHIRN